MERSSEGYDYSDYYNFTSLETDEVCHYEAVIKFGSTVVPIFFTVVVLLSLVGNVLVLLILGLYENLKSLTNIFILNLAVSDLIFTLGLPFWVCYYIWSWIFGEFMCKAVNFIFSVGFFSSVVFLMLMSIQRYVAVVHPVSDWNSRQRFAVPILAWAFSFAAALPDLLFRKVISFSDKHFCGFNDNKVITGVMYQQNIFCVVAFSVMAFCYMRILQTIFRSGKNNRNRTVRLIFCIVLVFFVSWAPYNIVTFLSTIYVLPVNSISRCDVSINLNYAFYVGIMLAYSHCCVNPVLYVFVGVKFRNHLRTLLQKMFRCRINMDSH